MQADPEALAKKILGMPGDGAPEEPSDDISVDSEAEAIEAAAEEASSAMGVPAPALAAFARTILRLARAD